MKIPLIVRFALSLPAILTAGYAGLEAIRFSRAERLSRSDTVEALQAALLKTPGNADYHARIATLDPTRTDDLRKALSLNPTNTSWWIMQSVRQEQEGDIAGARGAFIRPTW